MKANNKTIETKGSVAVYIAKIVDENKKRDFSEMVEIIQKATKLEPKMWGTAIVGFGLYEYKYESGREGTAPLVGLSARANAISLYLSSKFDNREELLSQFGKHKTGKACIYIQKLADIDKKILIQMVKNNLALRSKNARC